MKLTPELETKGLRAYEQVRAFEALERRGLPWIYAVFTIILVLMGGVMLRIHQPTLGVAFVICAGCFMLGSSLSWRRERRRYGENLVILAEMERTYGDQLPWVQVEKHFAELDQLKRDLEEERRREGRNS